MGLYSMDVIAERKALCVGITPALNRILEGNMAVAFKDTEQTLSETLTAVSKSITGESVTLRQLFELIGEQSMLLFCMFLMVPFLLPVSIPGVSTVFSLVVMLAGVGVMLNRVPWLPGRLMNRSIATESLLPALEKGSRMMARIDRVIRPRMLALTHGATVNRFNGFMLFASGVLLIFPFGLVPFSNTLPALAVLFLCAGMIQRDGLFILLGYLMFVVTVVYFGALFVAAIAAGQGISHLLGGYIYLPFFIR